MLRFLPVGLDVRNRKCLVVGGGGIGTRKAMTLARAGAIVTVVSPTVTAELAAPIEAGRVRWAAEPFREAHLGADFLLVVAATDDEALNAAVCRAAAERGALVCDASSAERSQVIFGALLERDEATVAVFTDGRDPARARRTRDRIEQLLAQGDP
jgi:siroheme synthase-like protein